MSKQISWAFTLITSLVIALLTLVLMLRGGFDYFGFKLTIAITTFVIVFAYLRWCKILGNRPKRHPLDPGETVLEERYKHKVVLLLWAVPAGILSWLSLLGFSWLWVNNTRLEFPGFEFGTEAPEFLRNPDGNNSEQAFSMEGFGFPLWPLALSFGLSLGLSALNSWQRRKHTRYVVSNARYFEEREQIPMLPWLPPYFKQTPMDQVNDVDYNTPVFGNLFGWGTFIYGFRETDESTKVIRQPERFIPQHVYFQRAFNRERERHQKYRGISRYVPGQHEEVADAGHRSGGASDDTTEMPPVR